MSKLEAYGIFIVVKTVETKRGTFVLNEFNRGEVLSIGGEVEGLEIGDIVYYQPDTAEAIQDWLLIRKDMVLCKVIE